MCELLGAALIHPGCDVFGAELCIGAWDAGHGGVHGKVRTMHGEQTAHDGRASQALLLSGVSGMLSGLGAQEQPQGPGDKGMCGHSVSPAPC